MKYCSEDGKMFDTEQECLDYEKKVREKILAETKKEEQRKTELAEIQDLFDELAEKMNAYYKKWEKPAELFGFSKGTFDTLPRLFGLLDW